MERIKEFVLNLPIDWILHGTDVPVIQLLLVGVVVAAICAVLALLSGVFDRELYERFDHRNGIVYTALVMGVSTACCARCPEGKRGGIA